MKIIRLQLKGYLRLLLNNISYVDYKPENKIQLILGTNGSGKSSLLKELSPLPANKNEYEKGGYKIIEIEHKSSKYILKCDFTDKATYSFIKNDEELNQGYTVSVYKQLVKAEFNIDNDVHDMLLGQYRFHEMSPLERRNWFTKISSCDYTYALGYYQRLREETRDSQGAIKLLQSRIVNESSKLLDSNREAEIRQELIVLNEYLNFILDNKPNVNNDQQTISNNLNKIEDYIKNNIREIQKLRKVFLNDESFQNEDEIDDAIVSYRSTILSLENQFNYLCQKIDDETKIEQSYINANIGSFKEIEESIEQTIKEINSEHTKKSLFIRFSDPAQALTALQTISTQLLEIFNNLPRSSKDEFSRTNIGDARTKQIFLINKLKEYNDAQDIVLQKKKELDQYKNKDQTVCPSCGHRWFKDFDQAIYDNILKTLEANTEHIDNFKKELSVTEKYLAEAEVFIRQLSAYYNLTNNWKILDSLFSYLNANGVLVYAPEKISYILSELEEDLKIDIRILNMSNKLQELNKLKQNITSTQESDLDKIKVSIFNFNKELHNVNLNLDKNRKYLTKLLYYKNAVKRFREIEKDLDLLIANRDNLLKNEIEVRRRDRINDIIKLTRLEISTREQLISNINIQKAIVSDLEKQLHENVKKFELLKIAVRKLSPNEGLIAKGLTGFINHFILELNAFIKKIWLYPLQILPVVIDDENQLDLNYEFKVKINDRQLINDISKTSSAMKEVIDLAFKVISMKYLGLSESPIYLDEFAASFDKEHRQKAYTVINNLMNTDNYSQIFTISHYEDCYGSFVNTDITILCSNNIPLPKNSAFNTVITIQ